MFTVKRIIEGDRIPTEHEKLCIGDRNSRVFREAMELLEPHVSARELSDDRGSDLANFEARWTVSHNQAHDYLRQLFPDVVFPDKYQCYYKDDERMARDIANGVVAHAILIVPAKVEFNIAYSKLFVVASTDKFFDLVPPASDLRAIFYNSGAFRTVALEAGTAHEITYMQVEQQNINGDVFTSVVKGARPGSRTIDDAIGVLCTTENSDVDVESTRYEIFYKGDEVYVVNSHGKTTDTLR